MTTRFWIAPLVLAGWMSLASPAAAKPNCSNEMSGVQGELVVITEDGRYCEASAEDRSSYEQRFVAPLPSASAPTSQIAGRISAHSGGRGATNVGNDGCVNVTGDGRGCLNTRFNFSGAQNIRPVHLGMF